MSHGTGRPACPSWWLDEVQRQSVYSGYSRAFVSGPFARVTSPLGTANVGCLLENGVRRILLSIFQLQQVLLLLPAVRLSSCQLLSVLESQNPHAGEGDICITVCGIFDGYGSTVTHMFSGSSSAKDSVPQLCFADLGDGSRWPCYQYG